MIPKSKPKLKKEEAVKIIKAKLGEVPPLVILAVRGYYSKSMGATDGNDFNIYDDAIIVIGDKFYQTYNANTDPSFVKKGGRALAKLNEGNYKFYKGRHRGQYNALRAYPEGVVLPCTRDGKPATCSYINIHKGGINTKAADKVWSEGCQTIPVNQWNSFIEPVYSQMLNLKLKTVDYVLIDNEEFLSILDS